MATSAVIRASWSAENLPCVSLSAARRALVSFSTMPGTGSGLANSLRCFSMAVTSGWTSAATGRSAANFNKSDRLVPSGEPLFDQFKIAFPFSDLLEELVLVLVNGLQLIVADPVGHFAYVGRLRAFGQWRLSARRFRQLRQAVEKINGVRRFLVGLGCQADLLEQAADP